VKKKTFTVQEAQLALEHYCSYQERTYLEVKQKLQKMNMIPEVIDLITISLLENNFINEERYARGFVRGKFRNNKWGRIKIQIGLKQKGVSSKNIEIGFTEITDTEYKEVLTTIATKQKPRIKAKNTFEHKQKLIRYLQQKGFEFSLIIEIVSSMY